MYKYLSIYVVGDAHYEKYWRLIDRMVQQAVIQQDHGVDPDISPIPINIQKLVLKYVIRLQINRYDISVGDKCLYIES